MKTYIDIIKDNVEYLKGLENIANDFDLSKYKDIVLYKYRKYLY